MTTLPDSYAAMAAHTRAKCDSCLARGGHGCCTPGYCEMAIEWARDEYGITLPPTGHPTLPLMGEAGCTAPPHLRPFCTLHDCRVANTGADPDDPDWTERYFELREEIEIAEWERLEQAETDPSPDQETPR